MANIRSSIYIRQQKDYIKVVDYILEKKKTSKWLSKCSRKIIIDFILISSKLNHTEKKEDKHI